MIRALRNFIWTCRHGEWGWGWELYKGKPMLGAFYSWYDGPHYVLHVGPLWIEVDG